MDSDWADVFPIENGDVPASYVSLPECMNDNNLAKWLFWDIFQIILERVSFNETIGLNMLHVILVVTSERLHPNF